MANCQDVLAAAPGLVRQRAAGLRGSNWSTSVLRHHARVSARARLAAGIGPAFSARPTCAAARGWRCSARWWRANCSAAKTRSARPSASRTCRSRWSACWRPRARAWTGAIRTTSSWCRSRTRAEQALRQSPSRQPRPLHHGAGALGKEMDDGRGGASRSCCAAATASASGPEDDFSVRNLSADRRDRRDHRPHHDASCWARSPPSRWWWAASAS